MHNVKIKITDCYGGLEVALEYFYIGNITEKEIVELGKKYNFELKSGGIITDKETDITISRTEQAEDNRRDKDNRMNLIDFSNELNRICLFSDSILFKVKWQQHDEDGHVSQRREEDIYAHSEKEAWREAYCEGEHENDYLISIDGISREELKDKGLL